MRHADLIALVESAHGCGETVPAEIAAMSTFNPWEDERRIIAARRADLVELYGERAVARLAEVSSVSEYPTLY